jgi:hypothetical protein
MEETEKSAATYPLLFLKYVAKFTPTQMRITAQGKLDTFQNMA